MKTDQQMVKDMVRSFRKSIKTPFTSEHEKKQYHWILDRKKKEYKAYFLKTFGTNPDFYDRNESIFIELLNPKAKFDKLVVGMDPFVLILRQVFCQQPNKKL